MTRAREKAAMPKRLGVLLALPALLLLLAALGLETARAAWLAALLAWELALLLFATAVLGGVGLLTLALALAFAAWFAPLPLALAGAFLGWLALAALQVRHPPSSTAGWPVLVARRLLPLAPPPLLAATIVSVLAPL